MSSFFDDESGVETSQPREGVEFETPAETVRVALGPVDVTIDGKRYYAVASDRGELMIAMSDSDDELTVQLPVSHRVPQRWMFGKVPPLYMNATLWRLQTTSGEVEALWRGKVQDMDIDVNDVATLHVPSRLSELHQMRIPTLTIDRGCQHILYDLNCKVDREAFVVDTTVASFDGRKVTVTSMGANPTDWATFGELLHVPSGERVAIGSQIGNVVTMQFNIPGMKLGDVVRVFAGCSHGIITCFSKFNNKSNFFGFPQLPIDDLFNIPT